MQNKNKIKRLIKSQCACFLGERNDLTNYCCLADDTCEFFNQENELPSCEYFKNQVLPMEQNLAHDYKKERNMEVEENDHRLRRKCESCGDRFFVCSNRQLYCEKCKADNEKEKAKLRMRKMRKRS